MTAKIKLLTLAAALFVLAPIAAVLLAQAARIVA
jgi:hypothetical protein